MNWAVFKYLVGHRFYPNHKRFKSHIYFFHETISLFALHSIEFYRNIGNLQSTKGRMMVKWNWRKSHIIYPRENEHLVLSVFLKVSYKSSNCICRQQHQTWIMLEIFRNIKVILTLFKHMRIEIVFLLQLMKMTMMKMSGMMVHLPLLLPPYRLASFTILESQLYSCSSCQACCGPVR